MAPIKAFIKEYFDLKNDQEEEHRIVESIRNGIYIKGVNLWVLIFAIFIASLGLNVNSTAVIIGAMLISPLMGPIMGIGLAIGRNDFDMLKKALRSYIITTLISVITATVYFTLTPLAEVQSELLARTSPTIYDVLIALIGGLAGIIAVGTKDKGSVITGVAIATALMPPLCTAGFGLATGNFLYFLGAFYLYFINSVFISLATFIGVRILNFHEKEFEDPARKKLVSRYIALVTTITMIPAIYMTYGIIKETIYEKNVNRFVHEELSFEGTQILSRQVDYKKKDIRVVLVGAEVSDTLLAKAKRQMQEYSLGNSELTVYQGTNQSGMDVNELTTLAMKGFYKSTEQMMASQQRELDSLRTVVKTLGQYTQADHQLMAEMKEIFPSVKQIALSKSLIQYTDSTTTTPVAFAIVKVNGTLPTGEKTKLHNWLRARTNEKELRLIME